MMVVGAVGCGKQKSNGRSSRSHKHTGSLFFINIGLKSFLDQLRIWRPPGRSGRWGKGNRWQQNSEASILGQFSVGYRWMILSRRRVVVTCCDVRKMFKRGRRQQCRDRYQFWSYGISEDALCFVKIEFQIRNKQIVATLNRKAPDSQSGSLGSPIDPPTSTTTTVLSLSTIVSFFELFAPWSMRS